MTGETWVAVGTGVLALATFVLAAMAYWNVRKTGDLVKATERSAAAAAATVLEIQRDRELAHRPYITWNIRSDRGHNKPITVATADVLNVGRAPAFHCLCCLGWVVPAGAGHTANTMTTDLFDLRTDESEPKSSRMEMRSGVQLTSEMAGADVGEELVAVAFCQDQLGNYFRFLPFRVEPDVYRPGIDKTEPRWMVFYQDQFKLSAKY